MKQPLLAIDQLLNTLAGGMADETLSARSFRLELKSAGWARMRRFVDALFFWQTNHCRAAYISEYAKRQMPGEYRLSAEEFERLLKDRP